MTKPAAGQPDRPLSIGQCAALACLLEASATKPGNVHRGADFEGLSYVDLLAGAMVIAEPLETAIGSSLGATVLAAVAATRRAVATNTNLGTLLLQVPLAMVPREESLAGGVVEVLRRLDARDAADVYQAIRLAQAGGLGEVPEADVAGPPPEDLIAAMRLAADLDLVARQYVNGFADVLGFVVPRLSAALARGWRLHDAIVYVHLEVMAKYPDGLIARKCGVETAEQASARAQRVLDSGEPGEEGYRFALADLDFWLRSDHHRRNPGTTADLLAAGLFAALRDDIIQLPLRFY